MEEEHRDRDAIRLGVEPIEGDDLGLEQCSFVAVAVHEWIRGVLGDRLGVAGHAVPLDRRIRHLASCEHVPGPVPVTDDGSRQDQAGQLAGMPHGVPGGEEASHRVSEHHHRPAREMSTGDRRQRGQVVDHVLEVGDQCPLPLTTTVAQVILGVDGASDGG